MTLVGISGGVSYGALGMSHHSAQDIAAMSAIPNMRVYLPSDRFQTAKLIEALLQDTRPAYLRVGRNAVEDIYSENDIPFVMDKATVLAEGTDVRLVACGEMVRPALDAVALLKEQGISAGLLDMYCVKPLDKEAIVDAAGKVKAVISVEEHAFKTDYSNASRTQLMNLKTLAWDEELAGIFGIPMECLAQICDSDAVYGHTTMNGLFEKPVPICGVLGDSHAALFGQGCLQPGMSKATYGTGSSLMMNIGGQPIPSSHGVVTSLAWKRKGRVDYVLEGNLNYTGAVITWLKKDVGLIGSAGETESLATAANPADRTYLVPAFTGLGAPYWDESAAASLSGMTRVTGKAEIVRAALDCIAYQITDLVLAMEQDTGIPMRELRVDGGPARNRYLMQFQSDISGKTLKIPQAEELSGIGAAYMAGISAGLYSEEELFSGWEGSIFTPSMDVNVRREKLNGWKKAVAGVLDHT